MVFIPDSWEARAQVGQPARTTGQLPSVLPLPEPETDPRMREGEGVPLLATGRLRGAVPREPRERRKHHSYFTRQPVLETLRARVAWGHQ